MSFSSTTVAYPTISPSGGPSNATGPLASLDLTDGNFSYNLHKYPSTSANPLTPDLGHEIIFYINIPTNSYWNNTNPNNQVAPVVNRSSNATRYGLRTSDSSTSTSFISGVTAGAQNLILDQKTTRTTAAISLYIPNTMVWSQNMNYENVSMNEGLGPLSDISGIINGIAAGSGGVATASLFSVLPDIIRQATNNPIASSGANYLAGNQKNILAALGLADNPQNYLLFKQIDFRHFHFDFILTPENQSESQAINQILYLFRFHSAPEVAAGSVGRFFIPPSTFDIDILHNGSRNQNIPRISTCVLESVNINYAGSGSWVTTYDGQPRQIKLGLEFVETEILTKDRISQGW